MAATATPNQIVNDPPVFSSAFLKVLDKKKKLVPFRWNRMQAHFHKNRTGRDLLLKARQLGATTYIQGEMFRKTVTSTRTTMTMAHDDDLTKKIRLMADRFWENCRFNDIQPARKYANDTMTTYPEFDSVATIATAGSVQKGRGDTYTDFHGSEVAFWKDAESIVSGAMQGGDPDVTLESTPNGAQGYFYELCMEALSGNGVWKLHFYPWWWDDAYRIPLSAGEKIEYTEEEQGLVDAHGLTPEQIKWRRYKILELKDNFKQEYPEDPTTCFLTSGKSYFGDLTGVFTAPLEVEYIEGHEYFAGMDFGQTNDFTAVPVLDRTTKTQVDLLHINKLPWKEIRKRTKAMLLGKWSSIRCSNGHYKVGVLDESGKVYKECPACKSKSITIRKPRLGAEKNNVGSVNIELLMDDGIEVYAFETNNESKAFIMSGLYEGLHTNGWKLQDRQVQRHELTIFVSVQLPSGVWKLAADGEGHDDTVIGLGIGHYTATTPLQVF